MPAIDGDDECGGESETEVETDLKRRREWPIAVRLAVREFRRHRAELESRGESTLPAMHALIERLIGLHAFALPQAIRDETVRHIRGLFELDPKLRGLVAELQRAT